MTKTKTTVAQDAAELIKGSAEHAANNKPGTPDSIEPNQSFGNSLVTPTPQSDAMNVAALFGAIRDLATDEWESEDRDTGQLVINNARQYMAQVLAKNIIGQIEYLMRNQDARCVKASQALARARNTREADRDASMIARCEAWEEREDERFLELTKIREHAIAEYVELTGTRYQPRTSNDSARTDARAAARKATLKQLG